MKDRSGATTERQEMAVRLHLECHMLPEIAAKMGISSEAARRMLLRSGIEDTRQKFRTIKPYRRTKLTRRQAFWLKVDNSGGPNECWPWTGKVRPGGYGQVRIRFFHIDIQYSHHAAFFFSRGKRAKNWVLHKCGNHICCNPAHLYDGTPAQNAADRTKHCLERGTSFGELVRQGHLRRRSVST